MLSLQEQDEIRTELQKFVGKPLWNMFRYPGHQVFTFGEGIEAADEGEESEPEDLFGVTAHCPWSLTGPDGFRLGSEHFPPHREPRDDSHARTFYDLVGDEGPRVAEVEVSPIGKLSFQLDGGYRLTVTPSTESHGDEHQWLLGSHNDPRGALWLENGRIYWSELEDTSSENP